jgi:2'-5' RNA ligase
LAHSHLKQWGLLCYNDDRKEMEQIRSFVAIELEEELTEELAQIQESLRRRGIAEQVRWVKPEGIHLTLKFLGNVPADGIEEIGLAVTRGSEGVEPFAISLDGVGCFPTASRPNVVWVGVREDTGTLARLQTAVEDRLSVLGYAPERRKYTPHLTLGRVSRHMGARDRRRIGDVVQTHDAGTLGRMQVREVSLIRSDLSPEGARYTRLVAVQLQQQR